jgi:hypothetical protein
MGLAFLLLVLFGNPSHADALDDVRFGAAIASLFNENCRPLGPVGLAVSVMILRDMPDQERGERIARATKYMKLAGVETFCALNEPLVKGMEEAK